MSICELDQRYSAAFVLRCDVSNQPYRCGVARAPGLSASLPSIACSPLTAGSPQLSPGAPVHPTLTSPRSIRSTMLANSVMSSESDMASGWWWWESIKGGKPERTDGSRGLKTQNDKRDERGREREERRAAARSDLHHPSSSSVRAGSCCTALIILYFAWSWRGNSALAHCTVSSSSPHHRSVAAAAFVLSF